MHNFILIGGIIADLVLISILVSSTAEGHRRGLSLLIYQAIAMVLTIILVLSLCKPVTNMVIKNTKLDESISKQVESVLNESFENIGDGELIATENSNISETIAKQINSYIAEAKEAAEDNISGYVARSLSHFVVSGLVIIGLSIIIRFGLSLLKFAISFVANLPLIKQIDKSGGLVFGLLRGFIIVYLILAIISLISPLLAETSIIAVIKNSKICSIFYNNNILLNIFTK